MLSGEELGRAIRAAIDAKGITQKAVAAEFGVKQPSVSEWIKYGRIDKKHLSHLIRFFADVVGPHHWGLETTPDWKPEQHAPEGGGGPPVAHDMSPSRFDDPPTLSLGSKMNWDALPASFKAAMPDGALAPEYPQGSLMVWSVTKDPRPGSLVLVRDRHDRPHVREYREATEPGQWIAAATNRAYPSFDPATGSIVAAALYVVRELP